MYRPLHGILLSLTLLVAAHASYAATPSPVLRKELLDVRTPQGIFRFKKLMIRYEGATLSISGTVTNCTERDWRHAAFDVALFDAAGRQIAVRNPAPATRRGARLAAASFHLPSARRSSAAPTTFGLIINDLPVGQTRYFHQEEIRVKGHTLPGNISVVPDDASQPEYQYVLIEPESVFPWSYDDEVAGFVFTPSTSRIGFSVENVTSEPLMIDWEKSAYVDASGVSHRIIHKGVRLVARAQNQVPTTIPPGARIDEQAYPADAVEWVEALRYWQEPPLFAPAAAEGQTFSLSLHLNSAAHGSKDYVFKFRIE